MSALEERMLDEIPDKGLPTELGLPQCPEIRIRPLDIPLNYRFLKWLMMAQIRRNPCIEIGGIIFTDQRDATELVCVVLGSEDRVSIPLPDLELLEGSEFNTCIVFHSHLNRRARFSEEDDESFRHVLLTTNRYLRGFIHQGIEPREPLLLYDFVLTQKGRVAIRGVEKWIQPGGKILKLG